jgi:putative transposase
LNAAECFRGEDVAKVSEHVSAHPGLPKTIRVNNSPEFVSKSLDWWAYFNGVKLDFSRPGKPTDNAFIEPFNGKFRQERLNQHWFLPLVEARRTFEDWKEDYNGNRPTVRWGTGRRVSSRRIPIGLRSWARSRFHQQAGSNVKRHLFC